MVILTEFLLSNCNIIAKKAAFQVEQDLVSKAAQIIGGNGNALANTLTEAQRDRIQSVIRGYYASITTNKYYF